MNIAENSFCPLNFLGLFGASWLVWAGSCEIDVYFEVVQDRETIETGYRVCFFFAVTANIIEIARGLMG